MGVRATMYGSQKSHYPCLKICHENEEKLTITSFWEITIESKLYTEPISMILVSFFSEDNVLSDKIKIYILYVRVSK